MGLDMYLSKRTNVRNWDGLPPEKRHTVTVEGPEGKHINPNKITSIIEEAMYWCKANAIHAWFVRNVQNDVDDCEEYYVPRELLVSLRNTCRAVLADTTKAATLLPPRSGFFFTDIDDWYWQDVERTANELDALLADSEGKWSIQFYYRSSW